MKILILCTGNSCRSQMAHGFMSSFDQDIEVFSAGTNVAGKLNKQAVEAMSKVGIDISHHTCNSVEEYLDKPWDYVITVCGAADESCPGFSGQVRERLHFGFDDPSNAVGSPEFIEGEFCRVRDEIKNKFFKLYMEQIRGVKMPVCSCGGKC